MRKLYCADFLNEWKKREKKYLSCVCALMLVSLAVCIFLCTRVNTGNADALLIAVIAVSAAAGWLSILLLYFLYAPARAQREHIAGVLASETEAYEGELTVLKEKIHIPKSVDIYKAALKTDAETKMFHLNAALLHELPADGTRVRLLAVRRFITAYEVTA